MHWGIMVGLIEEKMKANYFLTRGKTRLGVYAVTITIVVSILLFFLALLKPTMP